MERLRRAPDPGELEPPRPASGTRLGVDNGNAVLTSPIHLRIRQFGASKCRVSGICPRDSSESYAFRWSPEDDKGHYAAESGGLGCACQRRTACHVVLNAGTQR